MLDSYLVGPSHANGGIPATLVGSSSVLELEGGEFVVSRANASRPVVRSFLEALTSGKIDEVKLQASILSEGHPTSVSQVIFEEGGGIQEGIEGSEGEEDDGASDDSSDGDPDFAKFTQDDLDTFVKNRLGKETKRLTRQFEETFQGQLKEALKNERTAWEHEQEARSMDKLKKEEYDEGTKLAIAQEKRKWEAKYDADTKSLSIARDNLQTELSELGVRFESMREKQKLSVIRSAMIEGKIGDKFVPHLLPSLQNRVVFSDEFDDYVVLEIPGDMDSIIYNPKDKAKGVYSAGEWIREKWANEADIKPLRFDFKAGPGAPSKGGDSGRTTGDPGKSRIERGLRLVSGGTGVS